MEVLQHVLQSTQPAGACKIEQKDLSSARPDKEIITSSDMSTQCCVGPRAKPIVLVPSDSVKPGPSVLFHYLLAYAHPVGIDHTNKRKRDYSDDDTDNPDCKHKPTVFEQVYPSDEEPSNDPPSSPLTLDDLNDQEYVYEVSDNAGSSPDNSDAELESEVQNEQKFIVFKSCLNMTSRTP
ncbi:hypothetical protein OS493_000357 [Desmophyllum pertusum]|uniref:Uncharacterized protein n=1 Tax=Desmophyllum pertusum TaxID=174260 RepID=A0A9X0DBK7_9CNID|nr:hypothetical protein OS493_000357 [Desmophyllum pertusum]